MKKILLVISFILALSAHPAFCEEISDATVQASQTDVEEKDSVNADASTAETAPASEDKTLGMTIGEDGSIQVAVDKNGELVEVPLTVEEVIHTGYDQLGEIKSLVLEKDEDDLYADPEIKPLNKEMSGEERSDKNNTDFTDLFGEKKLPELLCSDAKLKQQVEDFIYQNINKQETRSVVEKRLRVLLVKNLKDFAEITAEDITGKNKFEALAAVMELKVNRFTPIYKICASKGNDYSKFESVYVVIYAYQDYYKVVVSNLMPTPNRMDEATFIYNW